MRSDSKSKLWMIDFESKLLTRTTSSSEIASLHIHKFLVLISAGLKWRAMPLDSASVGIWFLTDDTHSGRLFALGRDGLVWQQVSCALMF